MNAVRAAIGSRFAGLAAVRPFASVGEHRFRWGIVAWVVGTAAATATAMPAR